MAGALPFLSVAFSAIGLVKGQKAASQQKKARQEQASAEERTRKSQQRIADVKANAAKRKAIAEKKKQTGFNIAAAEAGGTLESSVFKGVQAGTQTQFAGVLSDAARITEEAKEASIFVGEASARAQSFMDSASSAQSAATIFSGVGDITGSFDGGSTETAGSVEESVFNPNYKP